MACSLWSRQQAAHRLGTPPVQIFCHRINSPLVTCAKGKEEPEEGVNYGNDWYRQTKAPRRTVRDELARRREANIAANSGRRDREDLYTDKWAGSEYKGSSFNALTVILIVSVLTPLFGIIFAYFSYGRLWG